MTETTLVQVVCPDCRHEFDVPDGAAEAQCPQCGEQIVWRSCLDTNEVFTVLKKWETWVHPGCETKHPVDLTHVLSAARPQDLDPTLAPVPRHVESEQGGIAAQQTVYSPIELAEDVEWADQDISGRLIVDSDRLAILPGAGATRPPLSVAWVRDVLGYAVDHVDADDGKKRSRFGRRKEAKEGKDAVVRLSRLVLDVPGGQISITATSQPDVLLAQLDQFLQPRIGGQAPPAATDAPAATEATEATEAEHLAPQSTVDAPASTSAPEAPAGEVPEAVAPEVVAPGTPVPEPAATEATPDPVADASEPAPPESAEPQAPEAAVLEPAAEVATPEALEATGPEATAPQATGPEIAESVPGPAAAAHDDGPPASSTVEMPNLEPETPEAVYESIRKLAELAVLGTISSEEFATKKAQLLARL